MPAIVEKQVVMDLQGHRFSAFCPEFNSSNVSSGFGPMTVDSGESENVTIFATSVIEACNCTTWNSDTQDVRGHLAYMYSYAALSLKS